MAKVVREVMSTPIQCCNRDTPIPEVAHIMSEKDVSAVIVINEEGHLAGIVSRTNLVELRGYDEYWYGLTAAHAMHTDVVTCEPDLPMREASKLLIKHKIHRVVVVEPDGEAVKPVGVLSQTDIVRDMASHTPVN